MKAWENFKLKYQGFFNHAARAMDGSAVKTGICLGLVAGALIGGIPAAVLGIAFGVGTMMLGSAAPMEKADFGTKVAFAVIPFAAAAIGGALGGLVLTTALAGAVGAVVGAGAGLATAFGMQALANVVWPENSYEYGKNHEKSIERATKLTAAALCLSLLAGGIAAHGKVRDLPLLKGLYNDKAKVTQVEPAKLAAPAPKNAPQYKLSA
jgi:hypothetical protein